MQIDPDVLERVRQIDLLSYLREFEPSNLVKVKGTNNVYCTAEHDSLKISNGKWYWWSRGFGGYSALDYLIKGVFLVERKDETDLSVFEEKYGYRWRSGR